MVAGSVLQHKMMERTLGKTRQLLKSMRYRGASKVTLKEALQLLCDRSDEAFTSAKWKVDKREKDSLEFMNMIIERIEAVLGVHVNYVQSHQHYCDVTIYRDTDAKLGVFNAEMMRPECQVFVKRVPALSEITTWPSGDNFDTRLSVYLKFISRVYRLMRILWGLVPDKDEGMGGQIRMWALYMGACGKLEDRQFCSDCREFMEIFELAIANLADGMTSQQTSYFLPIRESLKSFELIFHVYIKEQTVFLNSSVALQDAIQNEEADSFYDSCISKTVPLSGTAAADKKKKKRCRAVKKKQTSLVLTEEELCLSAASEAGSPQFLASEAGSPQFLVSEAGSPQFLASEASSPQFLASEASSPQFLASEAGSPAASEALDECVICLDAPREYCLIPCGHLSVCEMCADFQSFFDKKTRLFDECPTCRIPLEPPYLLRKHHAVAFKAYL
jgi:hypothetical protein